MNTPLRRCCYFLWYIPFVMGQCMIAIYHQMFPIESSIWEMLYRLALQA
jgi:hypothetical protein